MLLMTPKVTHDLASLLEDKLEKLEKQTQKAITELISNAKRSIVLWT
jgi:cwf18 pre-mRNA splicing factor